MEINVVLASMMQAIKNNVGENWNTVKEKTNQMLENKKERLALLAELTINKELTFKQFQSKLEDEKQMIIAELHVTAILSKATAQKAANAAIDVLSTSVKTAIKIL